MGLSSYSKKQVRKQIEGLCLKSLYPPVYVLPLNKKKETKNGLCNTLRGKMGVIYEFITIREQEPHKQPLQSLIFPYIS